MLNWLFKFLVAFALFGFPLRVVAQSNPSLAQWKELYFKTSKEHKSIISRLVIVNGWENRQIPIAPKFSIDDFNKDGFLKAVSILDTAYSYKMNYYPGFESSEKTTFQKTVFTNMDLAQSNAMLLLDSKNKTTWNLLHRDAGKFDVNIKAKSNDQESIPAIKKWIGDQLGYHAVVLDSKSDLILVANLLGDFDGRPLQALALKDSSHNIKVPIKKSNGLGLFHLVEAKGSLAVFKVIFMESGVTKVSKGTKLIIEESE